MEPRERIADVLRRPGAYGLRTFDQAVAFVTGFDAALDWTFLRGFREQLAEETGEGASVAWPVLASRLADSRPSAKDTTGHGENRDERMDALFDALSRFLAGTR